MAPFFQYFFHYMVLKIKRFSTFLTIFGRISLRSGTFKQHQILCLEAKRTPEAFIDV